VGVRCQLILVYPGENRGSKTAHKVGKKYIVYAVKGLSGQRFETTEKK
jgi:hypothetical protein